MGSVMGRARGGHRHSLTEKGMMWNLRLGGGEGRGVNYAGLLEDVPGRGNSKCKGPGAAVRVWQASAGLQGTRVHAGEQRERDGLFEVTLRRGNLDPWEGRPWRRDRRWVLSELSRGVGFWGTTLHLLPQENLLQGCTLRGTCAGGQPGAADGLPGAYRGRHCGLRGRCPPAMRLRLQAATPARGGAFSSGRA